MSQYEGTEPVRGLPQRLPAGEEMLWQGAPDWRTLARQAFHIRSVAVYFAVLLGWYLVSVMIDPLSVQKPELSVVPLIGSALLALGLIAAFAWIVAHTTVYTITTKRVVMRFGITLPMTWNIPFARIANVDLRVFANGCGELVLTPMDDDKFAYLIMWPHVKPWHIRHARPNLRCIPKAGDVAAILAKALMAGGHGMASSQVLEDARAGQPMSGFGQNAPQAA